MVLIMIGFLTLILGILLVRFPDLSTALKNSEEQLWKRLGSPNGYAFSDLGATLGLFSWLLRKEFETLHNSEIQDICHTAYKRARLAKIAMLAGITLVFLGFVLSIVRL